MGGPNFENDVPGTVTGKDNAGLGFGVRGTSEGSNGTGVQGVNNVGGAGVFGTGRNVGVQGSSFGSGGVGDIGIGVFGVSSRAAVQGESSSGSGWGAVGSSSHIGVWGGNISGRSYRAAYFKGDVQLTGILYKNGWNAFMIDHPLDPANKYLYHSSVESPDLKNLYDGIVTLDDKGEAEIELPDWFSELNKDFRYQLTAIGAPGPNLYIAEEISEANTNYSNRSSSRAKNNNSRFKIAGGNSSMKVSWQVTGLRNDPYAKANPIQVEEDKPDKERGYYIHPEVYGESAEKGLSHLLSPPKLEQQIKENKVT
jgi:hypothetical protein